MRLKRIAWTGYRVPFNDPFVAADVNAAHRHGWLVRLEAEGGLTGYGDASPVGAGSPEAVATLAAALHSAAPRLLDLRADDTEILGAANAALAGSPAPIRFAVETALCDLSGRLRGCPAATMLGGGPERIPVNALLFAPDPQVIGSEARRAVAQGFNTLKLKVGALPIDTDLARVAAARQAAGPGAAIRIDANQAWSVPDAIAAITRLAPYGLEYVEQPVAASDLSGLAAVRRSVPCPIAADEAIASADDARRAVEMEAADILVVKPSRTGLLEASAILAFARGAARPAVLTSSLESGVGIAATLHLASAHRLTRHPCGLATGALLESALISPPLAASRGSIACPTRAGLGIAVDEAALRRYATSLKGEISR